jgi:hypothetical protein
MSGKSELSEDVIHFIFNHITSVGQLDALSVICNNRTQSWNAKSLNDIIKSNPATVKRFLNDFHSLNILKLEEGKYTYNPENAEMDQIIIKTVAAFKTHYITVTRLIYDKPLESMRTLADAFKFRKDD